MFMNRLVSVPKKFRTSSCALRVLVPLCMMLHHQMSPTQSRVYDPRAATWMQKALQSKRLWGEEMQGNDEAASCRQVVRF